MAAVSLASVASLVLLGCSGSVEDNAPIDEVAPSASVSASPSDGVSTDPNGSATAPVRAPEELDEAFEALGLNDRGNVSVEANRPAEFKDVESGAVFATITATEIVPDFACTAPSAFESINGQFVAIRYDIELADNFPESGFPSMYFSVHEFRAWDGTGEGVIDPVGNAEACVSQDERVQTPLDPGDKASGVVVLDVPLGSGSASFAPGGFQGSYGWEWSW